MTNKMVLIINEEVNVIFCGNLWLKGKGLSVTVPLTLNSEYASDHTVVEWSGESALDESSSKKLLRSCGRLARKNSKRFKLLGIINDEVIEMGELINPFNLKIIDNDVSYSFPPRKPGGFHY